MKKIVQIVIKNTSTVDYTLPMLWDLKRRDPDLNIKMIYCVLNKKLILRNSSFVSDTLKSSNIEELDLSDFVKARYSLLVKIIRVFFSTPEADKQNSFDIKYSKSKKPIKLCSMLFSYINMYTSRWLQNFLLKHCIDLKKFIHSCDADAVLFDNRSRTNFPGVSKLYQLLDSKNIPTILLPHAPHYISKEECYMPFNPNGKAITDYCDIWLPLKNTVADDSDPVKEIQLQKIGYPAFDSAWRKHLLSAKNKPRKSEYSCLYIGRKFLDIDAQKPDDFDPFTLTYAEVFEDFKSIATAFKDSKHKIKLVIKPHPSSNFEKLRELVIDAGITNFTISEEIFYGVLPKVDFCVSPFSTSILIPAMSGIPTIVFNRPLQDFVHNKWDVLRNIYTGMKYYLHDNNDLGKYIEDILSDHTSYNLNDEESLVDLNHLREYYSDDALDKSCNRILDLIGKRNDN